MLRQPPLCPERALAANRPSGCGLEFDGADAAPGVPRPAVLLVLLVLQLLMRLALVDILLVLAPLAALLWILPQTQGWASLWAQRFVSAVFAQFVQMLALSIGISLVTGLPTDGAAALIQPLLGIAVLAVGLKIPSLIGGGLAGGNVVGTVTSAATGAAVGMGTRAVAGTGPAWRTCSGSGRCVDRTGCASAHPTIVGLTGQAPDVAAPLVVARLATGLLGEDLGRWAVLQKADRYGGLGASGGGLVAGWSNAPALNQYDQRNYSSAALWQQWHAAACSAAALDWLLGAYGVRLGSIDQAIALIGPNTGISTTLGLLDATGRPLAQGDRRQRAQPAQGAGTFDRRAGGLAGPGAAALDGARWFGEGHWFVATGYDQNGIYIRDSSGWDTRYLTWSRLYGEVGFSGWVVGVQGSG